MFDPVRFVVNGYRYTTSHHVTFKLAGIVPHLDGWIDGTRACE